MRVNKWEIGENKGKQGGKGIVERKEYEMGCYIDGVD